MKRNPRVALALAAACTALGGLFPSARAEDADLDALTLADSVPATVERGSDWRTFAEAALGGAQPRQGDGETHDHRLSLDAQYDHTLASNLHIVFADRLDAAWPAEASGPSTGEHGINTLKEAYLGWRAQPNALLDIGRINVRHGVATGYNPTDYFRSGALRTVVSINPASLKENRQGSAMLRGQWLWQGGSVTALYSPRLTDRASGNSFNPNWGATNHRNRWLIALSPRIDDNINPQLLVYHEENRATQWGLNLTGLVNDATVAYLEWSGGRGPTLLTQALQQLNGGLPDDGAFRNRLATGLTHTRADKLSLTLEYQYNGAALDPVAWSALARANPAAYGAYRQWLQNAQEPPTRKTWFVYAVWQDALITHLDLNAMVRHNTGDNSRLSWLEARYHWDRSEIAAQWQINSGRPGSEFGALPQRRAWQLLWRQYLP